MPHCHTAIHIAQCTVRIVQCTLHITCTLHSAFVAATECTLMSNTAHVTSVLGSLLWDIYWYQMASHAYHFELDGYWMASHAFHLRLHSPVSNYGPSQYKNHFHLTDPNVEDFKAPIYKRRALSNTFSEFYDIVKTIGNRQFISTKMP